MNREQAERLCQELWADIEFRDKTTKRIKRATLECQLWRDGELAFINGNEPVIYKNWEQLDTKVVRKAFSKYIASNGAIVQRSFERTEPESTSDEIPF